MKPLFAVGCLSVALVVIAPAGVLAADADDAGAAVAADAGMDAGNDQGPLGCGGGLCATDPGGTMCSAAGELGPTRSSASLPFGLLVLGAGAAVLSRRVARARASKERTR